MLRFKNVVNSGFADGQFAGNVLDWSDSDGGKGPFLPIKQVQARIGADPEIIF